MTPRDYTAAKARKVIALMGRLDHYALKDLMPQEALKTLAEPGKWDEWGVRDVSAFDNLLAQVRAARDYAKGAARVDTRFCELCSDLQMLAIAINEGIEDGWDAPDWSFAHLAA